MNDNSTVNIETIAAKLIEPDDLKFLDIVAAIAGLDEDTTNAVLEQAKKALNKRAAKLREQAEGLQDRADGLYLLHRMANPKAVDEQRPYDQRRYARAIDSEIPF